MEGSHLPDYDERIPREGARNQQRNDKTWNSLFDVLHFIFRQTRCFAAAMKRPAVHYDAQYVEYKWML